VPGSCSHSLHLFLSLCLSLSHTHTQTRSHTHTHTHTYMFTHTDHKPPHLVLTPLQLCANLPPPEYVGFGRGWLGASTAFELRFAVCVCVCMCVCVCVCMCVCASNGFHPHYPIIPSCCALLTGFLEGEFQTCHRIYSEFPKNSHWIFTPVPNMATLRWFQGRN